MAIVKIYDQNKQETGELTLASELFEVEPRPEILNLVVRQYRNSLRAGTHAVKTRAHVSGGGRKPFKQKGTGNARQGTNRAPQMRGGAIIFGPQPRDYSFKVNKKIRRLALRMAVSSRVDNGFMVVDKFTLPEAKTKHFVKIARSLELTKALIVVPEGYDDVILAARNIPKLKIVGAQSVNVYEVLSHKQFVVVQNALSSLEERLK